MQKNTGTQFLRSIRRAPGETFEEIIAHNPELDEGYHEWAAQKNAEEDAEFDIFWAKKEAAAAAAAQEPIEKSAEASQKRKVCKPTARQPRKQRKVVVAAQELSFSSSPDDYQIVQAGRARRQRALEEQTLRDEQSLLDAQLAGVDNGGLQDSREAVELSSGRENDLW